MKSPYVFQCLCILFQFLLFHCEKKKPMSYFLKEIVKDIKKKNINMPFHYTALRLCLLI